jgi:plasmid maintenance system killer protein
MVPISTPISASPSCRARPRQNQPVFAGLQLKGARRNQWAMTVNERWRICFEFRTGDAYEVEIVDYHRG